MVPGSKPVGGLTNRYAAWSYPRPSPLARKIKEHVAFLRGVVVEGTQEPVKGSAVGAWGKARQRLTGMCGDRAFLITRASLECSCRFEPRPVRSGGEAGSACPSRGASP
ncbi:DUF427 domain-containing protein [Streptomyces sp. NPDC019443]|uniref:DUF427 domain-containing protein n=1 Tax=Streptomyces sp. NPDC019443 TaxID=3365061 RepID=UPI0037889C74